MDQTSLNAFTDATRADLLTWLGIEPSAVTDLGGFESFLFSRTDRGTILRLTHIGHRTLAQILGELEWIEFLARHDAPVCRPRPLASGALAAQRGEFIACEFERAAGGLITAQDWNASLFRKWGRALGRFHRIAVEFVPSRPEYRRLDWSADPNFAFASRIPASQMRAIEAGNALLARLAKLPCDSGTYGLIHCDAHPGNFRYDGRHLAFFDFDDACYCWFAYDVATALFSAVLQPWVENTRAAQEHTAASFLSPFLEGYASEFEVSKFLLDHLGLFLKVRELSLYAVMHAFFDVEHLDSWYAIKFMEDRQRRIEAAEPFLDMSFR